MTHDLKGLQDWLSEVRFYRETNVAVNPMSQLSGNHLMNCFSYRSKNSDF